MVGKRKAVSRNPVLKALRGGASSVHVAAVADTRHKAMRKRVGRGSYRRPTKGARASASTDLA